MADSEAVVSREPSECDHSRLEFSIHVGRDGLVLKFYKALVVPLPVRPEVVRTADMGGGTNRLEKMSRTVGALSEA